MIPQRMQRKRTKGFDLQAASLALNGLPCVVVSRPGRWGNMFTVWKDDHDQWTVSQGGCHWKPEKNTKASAQKLAVEKFRAEVYPDGPQHYRGFSPPPTQADIIKDLRGKNVACFCSLDDLFCHGDVLLELAAPPAARVIEDSIHPDSGSLNPPSSLQQPGALEGNPAPLASATWPASDGADAVLLAGKT